LQVWPAFLIPPEEFGLTELPHRIQNFIAAYIRSLDALEVILFLRQSAPKEWEAAAIGSALNIELGVVLAKLEELETAGLVIRNIKDPACYRLNSSDPDQVAILADLAKLYASHRVKIITLIFTQPLEKIQTFADAFRFRKEEDDK
jgi:hypothetical protein